MTAAEPYVSRVGHVRWLVCALLFLRPAIWAMLGREGKAQFKAARLIGALEANGERQDYLRAKGEWRDGVLWARPFPLQDSSLLKDFSAADMLIVRAPGTPALKEGAAVEILTLE